MSAHGISPAWLADTTDGVANKFVIGSISMGLTCDIEIDPEGGVSATNTIEVTCDITGGDLASFIFMSLECDVTKTPDAGAFVGISEFCFVAVSNP